MPLIKLLNPQISVSPSPLFAVTVLVLPCVSFVNVPQLVFRIILILILPAVLNYLLA